LLLAQITPLTDLSHFHVRHFQRLRQKDRISSGANHDQMRKNTNRSDTV